MRKLRIFEHISLDGVIQQSAGENNFPDQTHQHARFAVRHRDQQLQSRWAIEDPGVRRNPMRFMMIALFVLIGCAHEATAQNAATPYATMAPINQYLMADQNEEIALARTAAPDSISRDSEVQVLRRDGFRTAVHGKNGFVCIVGRGWSSAADPDFWNPKVRVPICMNAPAARTYLPRITRITNLTLAGRTLTQVNDAMAAAVAKKELPPMEPGSMCYMMGKQGYGGDVTPHWPAHLMFFFSEEDPAMWGANLPGSPIIGIADPQEHLTQFVIPTQKWSDGTDAPATDHKM